MSQIVTPSHPRGAGRAHVAVSDRSVEVFALAPLLAVGQKQAVPTGMPRVIAFVHPILALASVAFMAYVASLGLRSRERGGRHLRPRHAQLATYAYAAMVANLAIGTLSTWCLRPDLTLLDSVHFRIGLVVVGLSSAAAVLSRWIGGHELARTLHPILGLLALVLSGLQVFFGMPLLPL